MSCCLCYRTGTNNTLLQEFVYLLLKGYKWGLQAAEDDLREDVDVCFRASDLAIDLIKGVFCHSSHNKVFKLNSAFVI